MSPKPLRIVSLLPAATEIVCGLGFRDQLVGRSHECDFPLGVEALPICTRALISPKGTSRQIDDDVKNALRNALSIYEVITDTLRELEPDIIVTQDHCEVCAVALDDVKTAVCELTHQDTEIVTLHPMDLDHVFDDIQRVADALGVSDQGQNYNQSLHKRLNEISDATTRKTGVACIEWADPLMVAGNWVPTLVQIAGGQDLFGKPGAHAPYIDINQLADEDPEFIIFMPCGFGLERSRSEAKALLGTSEWQALRAVKAGNVFATDGNSYFNRPGPRLVESAGILSEIFDNKSDAGEGWARVS